MSFGSTSGSAGGGICHALRNFVALHNPVQVVVPLSPSSGSPAPGETATRSGMGYQPFDELLSRTTVNTLQSQLQLHAGPTLSGEEDGADVPVVAIDVSSVHHHQEERTRKECCLTALAKSYFSLVKLNSSSIEASPSVGEREGEGGGGGGGESNNQVSSASSVAKGFAQISANAINSLAIFSPRRNSLSSLIDHCLTPYGSRLLRQWISRPEIDLCRIQARQAAVRTLAVGEGNTPRNVFESVRKCVGVLNGAGDLQAAIARLSVGKCKVGEFRRAMNTVYRCQEMVKTTVWPSLLLLKGNGSTALEDGDNDNLLVTCVRTMSNVISHALLQKCLLEKGGLSSTGLDFAKGPDNDHEKNEIQRGKVDENDELRSVFDLVSSSSMRNSQELCVGPLYHETDGQRAQSSLRDESQAHEDLSTQLMHIREVIKGFKQKKKEISPNLDEYRTVAGIEWLIEVPIEYERDVPTEWKEVSRTKAMMRFHTLEVLDAATRLSASSHQTQLCLEKMWSKAQVSIFGPCRACESPTGSLRAALDAFIQASAELDALLSMARLSMQPGYCCPVLFTPRDDDEPSGRSCLSLKGARHPIFDCDSYIPCDLQIDYGGTWILTGPNMGGKSALMRTVALISILAQVGCFVPATSAVLPIFESFQLRMGAEDNLFAGSSTFLTEMQETASILNHPKLSRSLVLMDEVGRGTSSFDGVATAHAVLDALVKSGATTFFVTHYTSVCEGYYQQEDTSKAEKSQVELYHMGFAKVQVDGGNICLPSLSKSSLNDEVAGSDTECQDEEGTRKRHRDEDEDGARNAYSIVFLYRPVRGVSPSSFGIEVARMASIPESILVRSAAKAKMLHDRVEARKNVHLLSRVLSK